MGNRTLIMGILNITPDSFSDGGKFFSFKDAVAQGERMALEGADIIDIGGESTRPFSERVSIEEEIRRVVPIIENLAPRINIPISVDTIKAEVAGHAIEAGASIINDISSLRYDPAMAEVAAKYKVPVILMHMKGTPETMQIAPEYDDLIGEICAFFENAIQYAESKGISKSKLIIDPGIGFGKTIEHNLMIISNLDRFTDLDLPIMMGTSRKAFIRKIVGSGDINPAHPLVETGTQASVAASILNGAHIVRVHNVGNTLATVRITDSILQKT